MRLQLTPDLERPSRGADGIRASGYEAKAGGVQAGKGRGKPDPADEAKWRDALGDPGPQTTVQATPVAERRADKTLGESQPGAPRSDGAVAVGDRASASSSHKDTVPSLSVVSTEITVIAADSAEPDSRRGTEAARFAAADDRSPPHETAQYTSRIGSTPVAPIADHSSLAVDVQHAETVAATQFPFGGADRIPEQTAGISGASQQGPVSAGADHGSPDTTGALPVIPAAADGTLVAAVFAGPGDPDISHRAEAAALPDRAQSDWPQTATPGKKTTVQTMQPVAEDAIDPDATATPLPDTVAITSGPRTTVQTGLGESMFRLRVLAEPSAFPALPEPVETSLVIAARPDVGQSGVPVDETATSDKIGTIRAVLTEEAGGPVPTEPRKVDLTSAPSAPAGDEQKAVADPEPVDPAADQTGRGTLTMNETAARLPAMPSTLAPVLAEPALMTEVLQTVVSLSGGTGPVQPLTSDPIPASPMNIRDLSLQIVRAVPDTTGQEVAVVLAPEELGTVRMVLLAKGENLTLQIHADRAETLDLMRRSTDQLLQDLRSSGFSQVTLDFGQHRRHPPPPPQPAPLVQPYAPGQQAQALPDTPAPVRRLAAGGLDLRL